MKVMDFGIARLMEDGHLTKPGSVIGSTFYMSPEQVLATTDIDQRSDIYSAGIVLYEMLCGRLPFDPDTDSQYVIQSKIVSEETPDPRQIYPYISDSTIFLLRRMTQKNRDFRLDKISNALSIAGPQTDSSHQRPSPSVDQYRAQAANTEAPPSEDFEDLPQRQKTLLDYWYIYLILIGSIVFLIARYASIPIQAEPQP